MSTGKFFSPQQMEGNIWIIATDKIKKSTYQTHGLYNMGALKINNHCPPVATVRNYIGCVDNFNLSNCL